MGRTFRYVSNLGILVIAYTGIAACNAQPPLQNVDAIVIEKHTDEYICTIKPLTFCPSWYITVKSDTNQRVIQTFDERQYNQIRPGQLVTLRGDRITTW